MPSKVEGYMDDQVEKRYGAMIDTVQPGTPCVVCGKDIGGMFSGHWCWKALMFGECPDTPTSCHLYEPDMQWSVVDEYLKMTAHA